MIIQFCFVCYKQNFLPTRANDFHLNASSQLPSIKPPIPSTWRTVIFLYWKFHLLFSIFNTLLDQLLFLLLFDFLLSVGFSALSQLYFL